MAKRKRKPTKPDFFNMAARVIDETTARLGRDAKYDDYRDVAFELFPSEMEDMAKSFNRQGFIKWLKDGMRRVANVEETDPSAPVIQLPIPGLPAPGYINIGPNDAPKLIRFTAATVADVEIGIAKRRLAAGLINARVEDLLMKRDWLMENRVREDETFGQACARMKGSGNSPRPDGGDAAPLF